MRTGFVLVACVVTLGLSDPAPSGAQEVEGLQPLAWLAGTWAGTVDGVDMEEHWTVPRGGAMLGLHRDVRGGRMVGFEYARIELRDGVPVFFASPGGAPPTSFTAVELGERRVVFENRAHDFPQRVIYWREGDVLHARIEGTRGGTLASREWAWRRQ